MTEAELIRRATDGDPHSIRELYERYAPLVFSVVRRIAGDDDLACDCAQEVWIRALRSLSSFQGKARFSSWLHRIAVNAAIQCGRETQRRTKREVAFSDSLGEEDVPGDVLLVSRLEWALSCLPEGMRRVIVLHDVEGYTHEEIGEVLGVSSGTSKSQLFKARAKMRDILAAESAPRDPEGVEACNT